ncbi:hypothetical protein [Nocardia cyriacigeorgica]|uniref:hypothetical protein n=1 Tax=Nocardia cyriacigeorgica TaxID=135487 RepID=UPI002456D182|nr:hypothetical protein [Nocardia cyriacigeorgica]
MRALTRTGRTPAWLAGAAIAAALTLGPAAVASLAAAPAAAAEHVAGSGLEGATAGPSVGVEFVSDTGIGDGGVGGFGDGGAGVDAGFGGGADSGTTDSGVGGLGDSGTSGGDSGTGSGLGDGGIGSSLGDGGVGGGLGDGGLGSGLGDGGLGDGGFGGGATAPDLPTDALPDLGGDSGIGTIPGTGETPQLPSPPADSDPGQPAPADPVHPHDPNGGWHGDRWPFPDPGYPFSPFFPQAPSPEPHDDFDPPCAPGQRGAHCDTDLFDGHTGQSAPLTPSPGTHHGLPFGLSLPSGSAGQL